MKKILFLFFIIFNFKLIYTQSQKENLWEREEVFFNFEDDIQKWKITEMEKNCVQNIVITEEKFLTGKKSLKIEFDYFNEGSIEKEFYKDLSNYKNLIFNIFLPPETPEDIKICFFLQDNEWLWYQTPLFTLKKNQWNRITINVEPGSPFWENVGHSQPWSEKTIKNIRKIGLKVFLNERVKGALYIDDIKGTLKLFPEISLNKKKLSQFEKLEVSFFLPRKYMNPFNPDEISVEGIFIDPDGNVFSIPGFYYQEYERKIEKGEEVLSPVGYPLWKIRFTPLKAGKYKFYVKVKESNSEVQTDINFFSVDPSDEKNKFIEVNNIDRRYFSFKNGEFFYPIGINVRSPTDERYYRIMKKETEPDKGTFYYEEIFKKFEENGLNFVEIWMAPWFAALEWKENRPGYRGLGYYNLRNAWKIDKILEFAEKSNIYIQLVIVNHGQLSTWCDQEWEDNPYNEKNGGFLKKPEDFFWDEKAKELFKNKLRYIVARWGYSPNIFSWEIINEMNLIGSRREFYKDNEREIEKWYREMTEYIKKIDPYNHLITAHYTILVNNKILSDVIDYTITNAYYNFNHRDLPSFLKNIYVFNSKFNKPTFISEYGGTPWASSTENLIRDIILGLWYSFHLPFASAPLFWWHRFIDEFSLFYLYKFFSDYTKGINRIKMALEEEKIEIDGRNKNQILSIGMGNKFFSSIFLYDRDTTKNMEKREFFEYEDIVCILKNKKVGKFKAEFYLPEEGKIGEKKIEADKDGNLKIEIPKFKKWIAVKINFYGE